MKYYYKQDHNGFCIEDCPKHKPTNDYDKVKIGSHLCDKCINNIEYNDEYGYVICKLITKYQRTKKLNTL
ncbi:hypothetical protein M0Q50_02510 [bacterium]|jgi:hypothetical protein|nr:hypothetical protein [bacterium]